MWFLLLRKVTSDSEFLRLGCDAVEEGILSLRSYGLECVSRKEVNLGFRVLGLGSVAFKKVKLYQGAAISKFCC